MTYNKRSFLAGVAVGRQLKGWSTGGSGGGGSMPAELERIRGINAPGGAWFKMPTLTPQDFGFIFLAALTGTGSNKNLFGGAIVGGNKWMYLNIRTGGRIIWWPDSNLHEVTLANSSSLNNLIGGAVKKSGTPFTYAGSGGHGTGTISASDEVVGASWAMCTFVDSDGSPRTDVSEHFIGNIYIANFYSGDELIHELIPARHQRTGKVGFWDNVRQEFYTSQGAAEFMAIE